MTMPDPRTCRHCGWRQRCRPRGLCSTCSLDAGIRALYPSSHACAHRGVEDRYGGYDLPVPTAAMPGTEEKLVALARRAAVGVALHHPADAPVRGDLT